MIEQPTQQRPLERLVSAQPDMETVHVYAQGAWHKEAYIAGNRSGLEKLRNALATALESGAADANVFVNDGEGYEICVRLVDDETANKLIVPYTEEYARGSRQDGEVYPYQLGANA